jgi:serine/threonine protein kinase
MQFIMAGTYGSAYRAVWTRGDGTKPESVVIKRIDLSSVSHSISDIILVLREKMLLQRLHHEHISSIMMQYSDPKNADILYFVLQDGGPSTLDNLLRDSIHTRVALAPSNVQIIMTHVSLLPLPSVFCAFLCRICSCLRIFSAACADSQGHPFLAPQHDYSQGHQRRQCLHVRRVCCPNHRLWNGALVDYR